MLVPLGEQRLSTSAVTPKADMCSAQVDVCFVPIADIPTSQCDHLKKSGPSQGKMEESFKIVAESAGDSEKQDQAEPSIYEGEELFCVWEKVCVAARNIGSAIRP